MQSNTDKLLDQLSKQTVTGVVSINDLREMFYAHKELTSEQRQALKNYDSYRINKLNASISEHEFHKFYLKLQAQANLSSYKEFLKEEYIS